MINNRIEEYRKRILQYFPERQIYVRSSGVVQYYVLSTRLQILAATGAALLVLWAFINFCSLMLGNNPFKPTSFEVQKLTERYESQLHEAQLNEEHARQQLLQQQESFAAYSRSFEEKHAAISELLSGSDLNLDARPLTATEYAESRVLMAPVIRDAIPRKARHKLVKDADIKSDVEIDTALQNLLTSQDTVLANAESTTLDRIDKARAILTATGIDIDTILKANPFGKGGVFVAAQDDDLKLDNDVTNPRLSGLKSRMAEAEALDQAMLSTPLGLPVSGNHYRTSMFGTRKDPFTKRPAHHGGIDFGAYRNAPIIATAPGKVKFSGRRSGYGKVVEIDHGHGFMTRYAHLNKTFVKRGQVVKKGEKVGGMGSTGRSTSTHLHYEIHFQGRAYDPDKFLKAGYYVQ